MYASKTAVSPDSASISIRHHGQFLKNVGSISLIRSSSDAPQGTLVVESDRGAFIHTCIPYSDIRVDFTNDYASAFVVSIKEKKARVNRLVLDNTRWRFGHRVNRPALGEIPTVLWNEIDKSLVDSGAVKVDEYSFENCPETILEFLPEIEIWRFRMGTIVLQPKQYMEFESGGRCTLLLGHSWADYDPVLEMFLNPFLLKNMF